MIQFPIFLALFLFPVYVPQDLLEGWISTVAAVNPVAFILKAGRSLLAGDPTRYSSRSESGLGSS